MRALASVVTFATVLVTVLATVLAIGLAPASGSAQTTDLLRAVATDVAVSSVYRNRARQADHLVDGDLDSAWNSRSGDLVGAWIEVRLPASATVSGVALTAGFTRRPNLFEGNHRVARVRISRDGAVLAERAVDTSSRELQTLPVRGGGGVYRIEVTEVLPGTRARWRELCISELQILGTAPGMRPGSRFPRVAVGALPAPASAPEPPSDRAAVSRRHRQLTAALRREWAEYERGLYQGNQDTGTPGPTPQEIVRLRSTRTRLLRRVFELVEHIDVAAADGARAAIAREETYYRASAPEREIEAMDAAMSAVADWLGDARAHCRWATALADLELLRLEHEYRSDVYFAEVEGPSLPPEDAREANQVDRAITRLERLRERFEANPRGAAEAFRGLRPPAHTAHRQAEAVQRRLQAVASRCPAR